MARNALWALLLLPLILFDGSDASFVGELRKLAAVDPKDNKTAIHDSPSPIPGPGDKKSNPKPVGETKKSKADPPSTNATQKVNPKGSGITIPPAPPPLAKTDSEKVHQKEPNKTTSASSPPAATEGDDGKSHEEEKKKNEGKTASQSNNNATCGGFKKCTDEGDLVACISKIDSKYVLVVLQNRGDSSIKVKLKESNLGVTEVAKHQTEKINISLISSEHTQLTFNAGKGDCVLHMGLPVPKGFFFLRLPSYDKILTPVNGAYFLILTVLVFGGTWACCKLRKKRRAEVPYQELEMALPESVSATDVETAEGWDQVWDDDWDEDVAVKSPTVHHAGSVSANGLTSRSSNRDGWENNWDD